MKFGTNPCPKCESSRDNLNFPFEIQYESDRDAAGAVVAEWLVVVCGRCSNVWREPTADADHNKQVADLKEATR